MNVFRYRQARYGFSLTCAAGAFAASGTMAQPTIDITNYTEITEYRIQSDDCGLNACGMPEFSSDAALVDFLNGDNSARQTRANGSSTAEYLTWRRNYSPFNHRNRQLVYLDFDAGGEPTFPVCFTNGTLFGIFSDYVYSQDERDTIQARMEADYKLFNYSFTQTEPSVGEFSTVRFGENDTPLDCSAPSNIRLTPTGGISILFGRADNIDFRNQSKTDAAFADASVWQFFATLDAVFGTNNLENFSGIPVEPGNVGEALSLAIVNQSSNTGAHELGHIQGLRHHDSIGKPGDGLPTTGTPDPNDFIPVFQGPQDASETVLHTMASGASVGLSFTGSTITDRFFGERSAVKLAMARSAKRVFEENMFDRRGRPATLPLLPIRVPNTLIEGENAGKRLRAKALIYAGRIDESGEVDEYRFFGRKGKFVNAELVSFSDDRFLDPIIGAMRLVRINWDGSRTVIAENFQTFEPFDPLIFDQPLPSFGIYAIEVDAPNVFFVDVTGDGVPDAVPLDENGLGFLRTGDYELAIYSVDGRMGKPHHFNKYKDRHPRAYASHDDD